MSNAQMNGALASSGVESMNRANMNVRQKTAVDVLNAILVLLKGTVTVTDSRSTRSKHENESSCSLHVA